nr:MAG TPA: hypothetical protein [Crassvirales sp.]
MSNLNVIFSIRSKLNIFIMKNNFIIFSKILQISNNKS